MVAATKKFKKNRNGSFTVNRRGMNRLVDNILMTRSAFMRQSLDSAKRNLGEECGYPKTLQLNHYQQMYEREGIGTRIVKLMPEESWAFDPEVYENNNPRSTKFEKKFNELQTRFNFWGILQRADEQSGIGHFGIIVLGIDDGKTLDQPVKGFRDDGTVDGLHDKDGEPIPNGKVKNKYNLSYLRVFSESYVTISKFEKDDSNPRFGMPVMYKVKTMPLDGVTSDSVTSYTFQDQEIHWTRVIHLADGTESGEVFATPRMRFVFNRLLDLRKLLGGSAEMFWKGAFPGYSFEVDPELAGQADLDEESLRDEFEKYSNSLQRYIAIQGVSAKSLAPSISSPRDHLKAQIEAIAFAMGVPVPILMGQEEAKLASSQNSRTWNRRVDRRRRRYLTPYVIRPFVNRLIAYGVLPNVANYDVFWKDLDTLSDLERAEAAAKLTTAVQGYVTGQCDQFMDPLMFAVHVLGMDIKMANEIIEHTLERMQNTEEPQDAMMVVKAEQAKKEEEALKMQAQQAQDANGQAMQMQDKKHAQAIELTKVKASVTKPANKPTTGRPKAGAARAPKRPGFKSAAKTNPKKK